MKKGTTEGTVSMVVGVIIAIVILYVLWRMYGGDGQTQPTVHAILGIMGR